MLADLKPYSVLEAVTLFFDLGLTEEQYHKLHTSAKERGADIYPPLYKIQDMKKKMMPAGIQNPSEGVYQIPMKNVLHHKLERLIDEDTLKQIQAYARDPNNHFKGIFKYGADGLTGKAEQRRSNIDQSSIYASYLVLLMIKVTNLKTKKSNHIYVNSLANSWSAVTYLRIGYEKEDDGKQILFHFGELWFI